MVQMQSQCPLPLSLPTKPGDPGVLSTIFFLGIASSGRNTLREGKPSNLLFLKDSIWRTIHMLTNKIPDTQVISSQAKCFHKAWYLSPPAFISLNHDNLHTVPFPKLERHFFKYKKYINRSFLFNHTCLVILFKWLLPLPKRKKIQRVIPQDSSTSTWKKMCTNMKLVQKFKWKDADLTHKGNTN